MPPRRIVLIANYARDRQQSMDRFALLLQNELIQRGCRVDLVRPVCLAGRGVSNTLAGLGKWLAYVDKYLLFPVLLALRQLSASWGAGDTVVHIVDHSNSIYGYCIWRATCVCTCHDVLAIRGALGDKESYCPTSRAGRVLQHTILRGLRAISYIGCDSDATRGDLERLTDRCGDPGIRTLRLGLNSPFRPLISLQARELLRNADISLSKPYLLHVGSSLPRKNRECVLRVLAELIPEWDGLAVFAGEGLSDVLRELAVDLGVYSRVVEVRGPEHNLLNALYSLAHVLVYPSYSEGFGWPVLEAQASGCPVICSDRTSVPEVGGSGAEVFPPDDVRGMAQAVLCLDQTAKRRSLIARGFLNLDRFDNVKMIDGYLELYQEAILKYQGETPVDANQH